MYLKPVPSRRGEVPDLNSWRIEICRKRMHDGKEYYYLRAAKLVVYEDGKHSYRCKHRISKMFSMHNQAKDAYHNRTSYDGGIWQSILERQSNNQSNQSNQSKEL